MVTTVVCGNGRVPYSIPTKVLNPLNSTLGEPFLHRNL